jgi:glycosyltransferase involved in cell wall biosynthesis
MISKATTRHNADEIPAMPHFNGVGTNGRGLENRQLAIVHEWLDGYAGSELVIEQMLGAIERADVFALVDFLPQEDRKFLDGCKVTTSFIQRLPFARRKFRAYLPLMPFAVEQFDLSPYDVVVSSNHAVAKGVLTREDQLHLCYVHTPVRYAWDLYHHTLKQNGLTRGLKSMLTRMTLHYLRLWDYASAARVDGFAANSRYVARRIWKTYRRRARVIYPPVAMDRFTVEHNKEDYYVTVSRLVPYKRIDLIVEAFRHLPNKQLIVIGDGPEFAKLSEIATPNVKLLGRQPAEVVSQHMQSAKAFLFAADEDFGIAPVEAQACGTPVIAYGHGGALETVVEGSTGLFFQEQNAESLVAAIETFESCGWQFDPGLIRAHAENFSQEQFRRKCLAFIEHHMNKQTKRQRAVGTRTRQKSLQFAD